jgi:hypothetical protein
MQQHKQLLATGMPHNLLVLVHFMMCIQPGEHKCQHCT